MENKKRLGSLSFWQKFNSIHLYATKGEAFAKAMIITISWIGGVFFNKAPQELTKSIGTAFIYLHYQCPKGSQATCSV